MKFKFYFQLVVFFLPLVPIFAQDQLYVYSITGTAIVIRNNKIQKLKILEYEDPHERFMEIVDIATEIISVNQLDEYSRIELILLEEPVDNHSYIQHNDDNDIYLLTEETLGKLRPEDRNIFLENK